MWDGSSQFLCFGGGGIKLSNSNLRYHVMQLSSITQLYSSGLLVVEINHDKILLREFFIYENNTIFMHTNYVGK